MPHFHKWTRWVEYRREFATEWGLRDVIRSEIWQRRECQICGKAQREMTADGSGHQLTSANNRLADGTLMDSSGATERQ